MACLIMLFLVFLQKCPNTDKRQWKKWLNTIKNSVKILIREYQSITYFLISTSDYKVVISKVNEYMYTGFLR